MNLKTFIILFILLMSTSCKEKEYDGAINLPLSREIETLDPSRAFDVISGKIIYQMYEPLYQYHYLKRPYRITPLLATDLPQISSDGKIYQISIKKNIAYHKNNCLQRNVKSIDILNSFKRMAYLPTKSNALWLFKNKIVGLEKFQQIVGNDFEKLKSTPIDGIQLFKRYHDTNHPH